MFWGVFYFMLYWVCFYYLVEYEVICHSFVTHVYLQLVCIGLRAIVQVYLVISPSFRFAALPMFGR
jgi:hypothetical protein